MLKIALTGGIGTGKTYISRLFIEMGIPVFYADDEAKKLYTDKKVKEAIYELFGENVFTESELDFRKMSNHIFSNFDHIAKINALIHPLIIEKFEEWILRQNAKTVILESAIIYEAHLESHFDKIFVVDAPLEICIERIRKRNMEWSEQDILKRIQAQWPQKEKCKRADLIILNV
ncbi:MAG: dephospho-CoA kinase [Bacteroidales bacterium]